MEKATATFKTKYPNASVILAGDLNCAETLELDTLESGISAEALGCSNLDADCQRIAPGHQLMSRLRSMGLEDAFRAHHPWTKAITRAPQGRQAGDPKRLDAIWTTRELTASPLQRIGIKAENDIVPSDHFIHYIDTPIDIVNQAQCRQTIWWERTKEIKIKPLQTLTPHHPGVQSYKAALED